MNTRTRITLTRSLTWHAKRAFFLAGFVLTGMLSQSAALAAGIELSSLEVNLPRLVANQFTTESKSFSGSVAFKMPGDRLELSMPFLWHGSGTEWKPYDNDEPRCCRDHFLMMDIQLRYYGNDSRNGLYAGLVARGIKTSDDNNSGRVRQHYIGSGATVGFRYEYNQNVYWSFGVNWITYADDVEQQNVTKHFDTRDLFLQNNSVTLDVLKVGVRFD